MIRSAVPDDLPAMLSIYSPYVRETTYSFEYEVPDEATFRARFLAHTAQCPWLVWEQNGTVLGYAYAGDAFERAAYRWAAEVSIYLAPECRRRGIGSALYGRMEEILAAQGYRVIYAIVTSENETSLHFHEALGYRRGIYFPEVGFKFGRWCGVHWLEKRLPGEGAPEAFPVPWTQVVQQND